MFSLQKERQRVHDNMPAKGTDLMQQLFFEKRHESYDRREKNEKRLEKIYETLQHQVNKSDMLAAKVQEDQQSPVRNLSFDPYDLTAQLATKRKEKAHKDYLDSQVKEKQMRTVLEKRQDSHDAELIRRRVETEMRKEQVKKDSDKKRY